MKKLIVAMLLVLIGCAPVATQDYCEHVWKYRMAMIYANPNLDRDDRIAEIYALGAALGLDPQTIEEDINELDPEGSN